MDIIFLNACLIIGIDYFWENRHFFLKAVMKLTKIKWLFLPKDAESTTHLNLSAYNW